MHKIVEKERELQNIETALEKNRSLAKEGRENEQVLLHNHVLVYVEPCLLQCFS